MGRLNWRLQELLAQENGNYGTGLKSLTFIGKLVRGT